MYWNTGTNISYLRYLAVATWRYHHPDWPIYLYQSDAAKMGMNWNFQDFQQPKQLKDYTDHMKEILKVEFRTYEPSDPVVFEMPPPNISDIFSYDILHQHGGWYADLDAICIRNFDRISDSYSFCGFGGLEDWVGIFGARQGSWVMESFIEPCIKNWSNDEYNSTGSYGIIKDCTTNDKWRAHFDAGDEGKCYRAPREMFYPVHCRMTGLLWESPSWQHSKSLTWSVHLFGGNQDYASANNRITPDYIKTGNHQEWVVRYIRELSKTNKELFLL